MSHSSPLALVAVSVLLLLVCVSLSPSSSVCAQSTGGVFSSSSSSSTASADLTASSTGVTASSTGSTDSSTGATASSTGVAGTIASSTGSTDNSTVTGSVLSSSSSSSSTGPALSVNTTYILVQRLNDGNDVCSFPGDSTGYTKSTFAVGVCSILPWDPTSAAIFYASSDGSFVFLYRFDGRIDCGLANSSTSIPSEIAQYPAFFPSANSVPPCVERMVFSVVSPAFSASSSSPLAPVFPPAGAWQVQSLCYFPSVRISERRLVCPSSFSDLISSSLLCLTTVFPLGVCATHRTRREPVQRFCMPTGSVAEVFYDTASSGCLSANLARIVVQPTVCPDFSPSTSTCNYATGISIPFTPPSSGLIDYGDSNCATALNQSLVTLYPSPSSPAPLCPRESTMSCSMQSSGSYVASMQRYKDCAASGPVRSQPAGRCFASETLDAAASDMTCAYNFSTASTMGEQISGTAQRVAVVVVQSSVDGTCTFANISSYASTQFLCGACSSSLSDSRRWYSSSDGSTVFEYVFSSIDCSGQATQITSFRTNNGCIRGRRFQVLNPQLGPAAPAFPPATGGYALATTCYHNTLFSFEPVCNNDDSVVTCINSAFAMGTCRSVSGAGRSYLGGKSTSIYCVADGSNVGVAVYADSNCSASQLVRVELEEPSCPMMKLNCNPQFIPFPFPLPLQGVIEYRSPTCEPLNKTIVSLYPSTMTSSGSVTTCIDGRTFTCQNGVGSVVGTATLTLYSDSNCSTVLKTLTQQIGACTATTDRFWEQGNKFTCNYTNPPATTDSIMYVPPLPLTSSSSFSAGFAVAATVIYCIVLVICSLILCFHPRALPKARTIHVDTPRQQRGAQATIIKMDRFNCSIAHRWTRLTLYTLPSLILLFVFIALCVNSYSSYTLSDDTRAALNYMVSYPYALGVQSSAQLDYSLMSSLVQSPTASVSVGVVGFSFSNVISLPARTLTHASSPFPCSHIRALGASGADVRMCNTLAAAGALTLLLGLLSLVLAIASVAWIGRAVYRMHKGELRRAVVSGQEMGGAGGAEEGVSSSSSSGSGAVRAIIDGIPSSMLHPRLYTVSALLSLYLFFSFLTWAVCAGGALGSHIFLPASSFGFSSSWVLLLVSWMLSAPFSGVVWHVVANEATKQAAVEAQNNNNNMEDLSPTANPDDDEQPIVDVM